MPLAATPILTLKPDREKSVLHQHPWIFSGAVKSLPHAVEGDIVAVQNAQGRHLGYGFYAMESQIVCRMFDFGRDTFPIDERYWRTKLEQAWTLRRHLVMQPATTAYRLLHAEGDFLPGVIIDVYGTVAVMQLLTKATERLADTFVRCLQHLGIDCVYLKTKESSRHLEGVQKSGWLTRPHEGSLEIVENGLRFPIDVVKGQKTGFFLDQRDNRALLGKYAQGKSLLNTFCYTGGFSAYALTGGAREVVSVDISKEAIASCEQTVALNCGEGAAHRAVVAECFEYLKNDSQFYDIVVLDPPAFAKSQAAVKRAARGYISLNELGIKRVKPGGLLFTFSCSGNVDKDLFRKMVFAAAAETRREVRIIHQLTQPADHPINIYHPEGEYLKGLVLHVV